MLRFFGSSDIKGFVCRYIETLTLKGQRVIDIPAGRGETSRLLKEAGAEVEAYDLFPEVFDVEGLKCKEVDIMAGIPEGDPSADMIICQEGLAHLPDQM